MRTKKYRLYLFGFPVLTVEIDEPEQSGWSKLESTSGGLFERDFFGFE